MTYDRRNAADKNRVLKIVQAELAKNKAKWDWIKGFSDPQMERLAKNVAQNIEKQAPKTMLAQWGDDVIASFVANLSRGHAGFIADT